MHVILEELGKIGIIPVIKIDDAARAVPLAKALIAGGIPCAEITFRTAQGEEAIRRINREVPDILLGAGTVLTTEQVDKAIDGGAKFIVSPGFNPKVVSHCVAKGIAVTPGCSSPTDMEQALEMGLEVVKFFPAEQLGGLEYIKAIAAPYGSMQFIPTGGINAQNIAKYIAYEKVLACGGSWMVSADLINAGEFDRISTLCSEAMFNLMGFQMVHVGINMKSADEAQKAANSFSDLFGFQNEVRGSAIFSGSGIEILKTPGMGTCGHIAIATNSVTKARAFFGRRGIEFNNEKINYDAGGKIKSIYFKEEIGGFAVHILQK